MSRDLRVIEQHLRHWQREGLLPDELVSSLRRSSAALARRSAGTTVRTALACLGGGLLLAGLTLIVAENWEALHRGLKLGGWAVVQCALLACAYRLGRGWPDRPALGDALAFVAGGWVLAGIALVSQIYQLDSRPPNGVWLWLVLTLPAAWLLQGRGSTVVLYVALVLGLALETGQPDSIFHATSLEGPWVWLGVPLLAASMVWWLPARPPLLRSWTAFWTFASANLFLLVLGARQGLDRSDLGRAWWLVGPALLLALGVPERCFPDAWDGVTSRLVLASTLLPWVLIGSRYERGLILHQTAVGLSWLVQAAIAIVVIRAGARHGSASWVNLGYLALLAGILTRYFDFFGDYLQGGSALALTGTLLLFILYALEKARRRTLGREARP